MKNTVFFLSLVIILSLHTSCEGDSVSPSTPEGIFISAVIDGNKVEYIEGDNGLLTWPGTGGSLGPDSCFSSHSNGVAKHDISSGDIGEGLLIGLENEYKGICGGERDVFENLFALGRREMKDEGRKAGASALYIDPTGVSWYSPDEPSSDNVLEFTKRTYIEFDPGFLRQRMDVEGNFSSWLYNQDGDSLRLEDGKFRLFFVANL
ncbi:MAG: hypothetical protein AAF696_05840 [Bacteroidota bacterium]